MLLGLQRYGKVDIRVKVNGGGNVAQVYAVRQAIGKALVAYYQKCTSFSSHTHCIALPTPKRPRQGKRGCFRSLIM